MFDWSAARPPRNGEPHDAPTIPLTPDERASFEALSRLVEPRRALPSLRRPSDPGGSNRDLAIGVALVVVGGVWCLGWLSTSVALSFLGVVAQALGLGLAIESQAVRRARSASAVRPEASPSPPHAHRRQGS
jgi:hypothetical protein